MNYCELAIVDSEIQILSKLVNSYNLICTFLWEICTYSQLCKIVPASCEINFAAYKNLMKMVLWFIFCVCVHILLYLASSGGSFYQTLQELAVIRNACGIDESRGEC